MTGVKSDKYNELQTLANDLKETHDLFFIYIIEPLRADPPDNMMDVLAAYTLYEKTYEADELTDLGNYTGDAYPRDVALEYLKRMGTDTPVRIHSSRSSTSMQLLRKLMASPA